MNEMNLMQAMRIVANAGLTVITSDGNIKAKPKKKVKNRRAKGSGSVYKLSGQRSKPYVACVTLGYDDVNGNQIKKPIGYYATQDEAQNALEIYNMQKRGLIKSASFVPTIEDLKKDKVKCPTVKEIWNIVFDEEVSKKSYSTIANQKTAFLHLNKIHNMKINEVNLHVLQPVFDEIMKNGAGKSKLNHIKVVCKKIFNYAMKYDYVEKDYSQFINYEATNKPIRERKPFSNEEIRKIIKDGSTQAKIVLISIFTGLRPQELIGIEKKNVFIDENYIVGGMKTSNGKNRVIPIHNLIKPYIEELLTNNSTYLIYDYKGLNACQRYRKEIFSVLMNKLELKHDPYETRHTFATLAKLSNVNEYARKKIMGHSCNDLTDDVYTHAPINFLVNEINKIKIESD